MKAVIANAAMIPKTNNNSIRENPFFSFVSFVAPFKSLYNYINDIYNYFIFSCNIVKIISHISIINRD